MISRQKPNTHSAGIFGRNRKIASTIISWEEADDETGGSHILLRIGEKGANVDLSKNPIVLSDLFFCVGGVNTPEPCRADIVIHNSMITLLSTKGDIEHIIINNNGVGGPLTNRESNRGAAMRLPESFSQCLENEKMTLRRGKIHRTT